eukprot:m.302905 g.302905  ORF g.302905 m.302905 type:complete len:50 (+) comp40830_c0_seq6:275-424(+)
MLFKFRDVTTLTNYNAVKLCKLFNLRKLDNNEIIEVQPRFLSLSCLSEL